MKNLKTSEGFRLRTVDLNKMTVIMERSPKEIISYLLKKNSTDLKDFLIKFEENKHYIISSKQVSNTVLIAVSVNSKKSCGDIKFFFCHLTNSSSLNLRLEVENVNLIEYLYHNISSK